MNGEVGGGCGEATGAASGDGAMGDAGDADTLPGAPPPPLGGDVRLNELLLTWDIMLLVNTIRIQFQKELHYILIITSNHVHYIKRIN